MARLTQGLRGKVWLLLTLVALVPSLLLVGLGLTAVTGLSRLAREQTREAFDQELRRRLISRVQEKARADDALFQGVLNQAVSLGRYVQWYYDHPENQPEPGYLRGGSALLQTPLGHRVNQPDTPVGVFVSRRASMSEAVWNEVGTLSFADPLLTSINGSTPGAERVWIISATRIARVYPNLKLGHEGSPVGPDYDLTEDEPFQAAAPVRNPHGLPVWTAAYSDPATGRLMITAVAPVYGADGQFRAVAGIDMSLTSVIDGVLSAPAGNGEYAFLLDRNGQMISAPSQAFAELGLPEAPDLGPGRASAATLDESAESGVQAMAEELRGAMGPGLTSFATQKGRRHVAYAPLPATGWVLAVVAPSEEVERSARAVTGGIRKLEALYLFGGAIAVAATLGVAAVLALRASQTLTRPVLQLVDGTRRLAGNLSHRLPEMGQDEFGDLARAFNVMAGSLEESKGEAVRQARLVVEERNRLAREIHDTLAQGLAGIVLHLETAEDCLSDRLDPEAQKHLHRARQLARESLQEARRSVWNLRPSAVEGSGLLAALEQLGAAMRQDGLDCTVEVETEPQLSSGAEDALYRVCQEALANVRKHSGAARLSVRLTCTEGEALLTVTDDGKGFAPASLGGPRPEGGFGLWAMRERLAQCGGALQVESSPGLGTTIRAQVPLLMALRLPDGRAEAP